LLPIDSLGPLQKSKNYIYDFGYRFGYRHQFALLLANYAKLQMVMGLASPLIPLSFPYLSWTCGVLRRLKIRRVPASPTVNRDWRTLTKHQHSKPLLEGIEFRKNEAVNSRTAGANTGTYAAARCTIARRPNQGTWADPTRSARGTLVANLATFWQQISAIVPVLPTVPTHKLCAVYNLAFEMAWKPNSPPAQSKLKGLSEAWPPRPLIDSMS